MSNELKRDRLPILVGIVSVLVAVVASAAVYVFSLGGALAIPALGLLILIGVIVLVWMFILFRQAWIKVTREYPSPYDKPKKQ